MTARQIAVVGSSVLHKIIERFIDYQNNRTDIYQYDEKYFSKMHNNKVINIKLK